MQKIGVIIMIEPQKSRNPTRSAYWREKAFALRRLVYVVGASMFILGAMCAGMILIA